MADDISYVFNIQNTYTAFEFHHNVFINFLFAFRLTLRCIGLLTILNQIMFVQGQTNFQPYF